MTRLINSDKDEQEQCRYMESLL